MDLWSSPAAESKMAEMRELGIDDVPGYFESFQRIYVAAQGYFKDNDFSNYTYPGSFISDMRKYG